MEVGPRVPLFYFTIPMSSCIIIAARDLTWSCLFCVKMLDELLLPTMSDMKQNEFYTLLRKGIHRIGVNQVEVILDSRQAPPRASLSSSSKLKEWTLYQLQR